MAESTPEISTLEDLRAFVLRTVCTGQQLLPDTVRVSKQILVRQGKPCGLQFTLNGPRSVQFSAIWMLAARRSLSTTQTACDSKSLT